MRPNMNAPTPNLQIRPSAPPPRPLASTRLSSRTRAPRSSRRHGLSSLLAMLFLVLFSTLAVGFYTASATSSQISGNNRSLSLAQSAAEAGTQYIRYRLFKMTIDPATTDAALMTAIAADLNTQINQGAVMNGNIVTNTGGVIYIPSATGWSTVDSAVGTKFRAKIEQSGKFLVVTVNGTVGSSDFDFFSGIIFGPVRHRLEYPDGEWGISGRSDLCGVDHVLVDGFGAGGRGRDHPHRPGGQRHSRDRSLVHAAGLSHGSSEPLAVATAGRWPASGSRRSQRRAQFGATLWGLRTGSLQKQG